MPRDDWPVWALLAVALSYAVAQVVLFPWDAFYLGRDEAIYLTQVVPGEVALDMAPHRTRGISFLVAPIGPWAHSMPVLRGWMTVLGALGVFLAFRPWVRSIGWAAPAAALVFVGYWVNLLFGTQLYPNFFTAIGTIAAAGHFVSYLRDARNGNLVLAAVWIAFTGLVRPLDAVLVGLALWVGMLLFKRKAFLPATLTLAVGGLAGLAPWLVEGWVRFGHMPWEHALAAQDSVGVDTEARSLDALRRNTAVYLDNTDGPYRCVTECIAESRATGLDMRIREQVIVAGMLAASALGLTGDPRRHATRATYVAGIVTAALLAYYLTCDCAINLRYLQPAFGFVALMIGSGVVVAWRVTDRFPLLLARALRLAAVVLFGGWAVYQAVLAHHTFENAAPSTERAAILGEILTEHAGGEPCAVAAAVSDRQIQFFSECLAVSLRRRDDGMVQNFIGGSTSIHDLGLLADAGYRIFAVGRPSHVPESSPVWDWEVEDISDERLGDYRLFIAPEDVEIETRYREGYSPEDAGPP